MKNLPIACSLTAAELSERREGLLPGLIGRAAAREPLPGGFRWRFAEPDGLLPDLAGVIDAERVCCPFLEFRVVVESGRGPVWLEVTGPDGTVDFLRTLTGD